MAILTINWCLNILMVFLFALVVIYVYMTRNFKYWQKRGVIEVSPIPFFGNFLNCFLFRESAATLFESLHQRGKGLPYLGAYLFDKPILLLRDPDIIKSVLIKDFHSFDNRYVSSHDSDLLAASNLFLQKNPGWKPGRNELSPFFTTAKLKNMFPLMSVVGDNLIIHLDNLKLQAEGRPIEIRDICARYTTDVITSCAFGLQDDSLNDPAAAFRKCGEHILGSTFYLRSAQFATFFFAPAVAEFFNFNFFSKEATSFMRKVFKENMDQRIENNIRRNDLIDLLIQQTKSQVYNVDKLAGQAATFFTAGFDTSASTISFSLYELAKHPDIQSRLRRELISALEETDGQMTYQTVMELPYLDMVVSETLRKYPSLPILDRVAACDYRVPGTDLVIEEGSAVYISLFGLHHDPEYFPDPEKYDPERFSNENKQKRHPCAYIPFGDGPRNCIGLRFGQLVSKLGILKFISKYEFTTCAETPTSIRFEPKAILLQSEGGLFLHARPITTAVKNSN